MTNDELIEEFRRRMTYKAYLNERDAADYGEGLFRVASEARAMAVKECLVMFDELFHSGKTVEK